MKVFILAALIGLTFSSSAEVVAFPDADGSHDIGSAAAWGDVTPQTDDTVSFASGVTYSLSADKSLPGPIQLDGTGKVVFDFSTGGKTLSAAGALTDSNSDGRETVLKGGTWNLTGGGMPAFLYGANASLLLDGVTMETKYFPRFAKNGTIARDSRLVLTNATKVTMTGSDSIFFGASSNWNTNNEVLVTGGSEIDFGNNTIRFGGTYGAFHQDHCFDNRFIVRGAGSKVYTSGANGAQNIVVGYQSGGSTVIVEDGGWLFAYSTQIGSSGGGVSSERNTLIVRNNGICTNVQGSALGSVQGSHSNRLVVVDGGQFNVGKASTYAQFNVGKSDSSYNSIVLSNGLISARWVDIGFGANSHNNRFEISGDQSKLVCTDGGPWRLFGAGYDNEVVVDNGANFSFGLAVNANPGSDGAVAGSNNTFAVRHGSTFTLSNKMTIGDAEKDFDALNTKVEVSGGSSFFCQTDFSMQSVGGLLEVTGGSQMKAQRLLFGDRARAYPGMTIRVAGENSLLNVLATGGAPCTTLNASGLLVSIEDGAMFKTDASGNANPVTIGDPDAVVIASSNRVFIGSGATMRLQGGSQFNFYSSDSELVISNGTLVCGTTGYPQFNFNSFNGSGNTCVGTNSTIVFQGDSPELVSEGTMQMHFGGNSPTSGTTVRFELPPTGYARAPIRHTSQSWAGEDLKIELTGLEALQETLKVTTEIPLWEQSYAFQNQAFQHAVDRLNPTLPRGCSVRIASIQDDPAVKYRMVLTVKPHLGMLLLVR